MDGSRISQGHIFFYKKKSSKPICVFDEEENFANTDQQKAKLVAEHFQRVLAPETAESKNKSYPPLSCSHSSSSWFLLGNVLISNTIVIVWFCLIFRMYCIYNGQMI